MWLFLLSLIPFISAHIPCPVKCVCAADISIACHGLSVSEVSHLVRTLSDDWWSNIRELSIHTSPSLHIDALPMMNSLETLDISDNQMSGTWSTLGGRFRSVKKLNIANNGLKEISRALLFPFPSIEEVYAGHNNISSFGFDSLRMPKMRVIHLNDNQITSIGMHTLRFMPYLYDVDFSGNLLNKFATSDFSLVGGLRYLNLSRNKITSIECDTAQAMPSLEVLDLSQNKLNEMPRMQLNDMTGLRTLNLSGNPITRAGERHISLEYLKVLDLSHSSLRVVEAAAFSSLSELHTLHLNDNPQLNFLSPSALENISLFSLDLSNSGVKTIAPSILQNVAQIRLKGVPLDCGCLAEQLPDIGTTTITDWDKAYCMRRQGTSVMLSDLSRHSLHSDDTCRPEAILPFGTKLKAALGQTFTIYCAGSEEDDVVVWKGPSGVEEIGSKPEKRSGLERLDYFTSTLFEPQTAPIKRKRALATSEYFRLDVVLSSDQGAYECTIKRGGKSTTRKIELEVITPPIKLEITDVGITTMHLAWNINLNVRAADRVSLQVESRAEENDYKRAVQLSLQNIYCSYNMINLTPNKNYTICLRWLITDDNSEIFSNCVRAKTLRVRSILEEFSPEFLAVVFGVLAFIIIYMCLSHLWRRLHIYSTAKNQSKLIQSVSGQSILSQSISSDTTMYENHQLELTSSRSTARDSACGPLLSNVV